jgi:hypothetical protein
MIHTVIIGADQERVSHLDDEMKKVYDGKITPLEASVDLAAKLEELSPDIVIFDIGEEGKEQQIDSILSVVEEFSNVYPSSKVMVSGKIAASLKKRLKDNDFDISGAMTKKIIKDYQETTAGLIRSNANMIKILTHFFTPHLVGHYDTVGFDLFINGGFEREELLSEANVLYRRLNMFSSLLTEENKKLLETTLNTFQKEELSEELRDAVREAFYFQFTTLPSLENFSDERQYFAESAVIKNIWETVTVFARENGDGIIFGCSKTDDIIKLKIAINQTYDLKKISKRTKLYQVLAKIRPYGSVVVTCGTDQLTIGKPQDSITESEGLTFEFFFRVIIPVRRRRGLKRF